MALGIGLVLCMTSAWAQKPSETGNTSGTKGSPAVGGASKTASTKTSAPAVPASTMQIKREVTGDLTYRFITSADSSAAPVALPTATGADSIVSVVVPAELKSKSAQIEVIDDGKGKVARFPVTTSGVVPLTANDFQLIQTVFVPVQVRGKGGLTSATVTLADSAKKYARSWLLKPSDNGVAQFADVPQGVPVTVTVTAGGNTPVSQTQTLPSDPPADGYKWSAITVDWQDARSVALPPAPAPFAGTTAPITAPTSAPVAPQSGGDVLSGLVSMVVSLLFLCGVAYGLLWAYKQGHLKKMLDGLGIQTQPVAATGPQGSPFAHPERAPIQPITEGTADPLADGAGFAVVPGAPPVVSAGPRLVATGGTYAGSIFPVNGGAVDIGRDPMNPVALPQDTNASRRHATLQASSGQYTVTDNGSSNGTYVNGVRINSQSPQPLRPGDELQIGMTRFRFEA